MWVARLSRRSLGEGGCVGAFESIHEKTHLPKLQGRELQEAAAGAWIVVSVSPHSPGTSPAEPIFNRPLLPPSDDAPFAGQILPGLPSCPSGSRARPATGPPAARADVSPPA